MGSDLGHIEMHTPMVSAGRSNGNIPISEPTLELDTQATKAIAIHWPSTIVYKVITLSKIIVLQT